MQTTKAHFTPPDDRPFRPTCGDCGQFIDDGSAVLEHQCRDCYTIEMIVEISALVDELVRTTGITNSELTKSWIHAAILRLGRYGRRVG